MRQFVLGEVPYVWNHSSITGFNALGWWINRGDPLADELLAAEVSTDAWFVGEDEVVIDE